MKVYILNFLKYKDLIVELVRRDIAVKYRNSYLGVLWSLLNPLLMMVVLSIIFSTVFNNAIENYPLYLLTGRLIYSYFAEATNFAMDSIVVNHSLIKKVYIPKYFFPLSKVFSSFITSLVALIPIAGVMIFTGVGFSLYNLLALIPLIILLITCAGAGLILATVMVFFRDLKHFYSIVLMIIMYMTPIFYPASIIPEKYRAFIELNPLFPLVNMFRDAILYQRFFEISDLLQSIGYAITFLIVGSFVFYKFQDRFIFRL